MITSDSKFAIHLPEQPASFTLSAQNGEEVVRITADGDVIVNPKFTVDEAAKTFWDAVKSLAAWDSVNRTVYPWKGLQ